MGAGELPGWPAVAARLHREHCTQGRRLLRLLRRAGGAPAAGSGSSGSRLLAADLEVTSPGLMPCGGTIAVRLVASEAQLASLSSAPGSGCLAGAAGPEAPGSPASPGWDGSEPSFDCTDFEELRGGASALAQRLLSGGSAEAAADVIHCAIAAAAAAAPAEAPAEATAAIAPAPGEEQQQQQQRQRHVWTEALPGLEEAAAAEGRRWRAELLRSPKPPDHLVIHAQAGAALAPRVAALCQATQCCLVAVEAAACLASGDYALAWILFVPDLPAAAEDGRLAAALRLHLQ